MGERQGNNSVKEVKGMANITAAVRENKTMVGRVLGSAGTGFQRAWQAWSRLEMDCM